MTNTTLKISSPRTVKTYCGYAADVWDYRVSKSTTSLRVFCRRFHEIPNIIEVRVVKGDGRAVNFNKYVELELETADFTMGEAQTLVNMVV